jgi:hypothetical protein
MVTKKQTVIKEDTDLIVLDSTLKQIPNEMVKYFEGQLSLMGPVSPERIRALTFLTTPEAPEWAVKTHEGKGGKQFAYIQHVVVSANMNEAFGPLWGMDVKSPQIMADGSASALVTVWVDFPKGISTDGELLFHRRSVTEVGAFDAGGGAMSKANMLAAAVSRGMVKAVFRMFRLGENLYKDVAAPTKKSQWSALKKLAEKHGQTEEWLIALAKEMGFTQDDLLTDKFGTLYKEVYDRSTGQGDVPIE